MEPNTFNNQEEQPVQQIQPVQAPPLAPPETPPPAFTQPQQPHTTFPTPKKSNKKLYIAVAVIAVLVLAALIGYFVLSNNKSTPADNGANAADTSRVGLITSILTNSAADESKTTNTSDSNVASDASSAANKVGDSVDENNLK